MKIVFATALPSAHQTSMKIRAIKNLKPLSVSSRISRLARVEFDRSPYAALLKEPAQFWDQVFVADEAYVLSEVTHPGIRRELAYDATSHRLFLEFIEAETLDDLVQKGVTCANPARTHRLLQSLAETVADMHAGIFCGRPIIHNDLKIRNVLVPLNAPDETRLIDFSHSFFEGNLPPFITDKKQDPLGTVPYAAPEKWDRDFTKGFEGDVFVFGVIAYYACTGKLLFDGDNTQIEKAIRHDKRPSPLRCSNRRGPIRFNNTRRLLFGFSVFPNANAWWETLQIGNDRQILW